MKAEFKPQALGAAANAKTMPLGEMVRRFGWAAVVKTFLLIALSAGAVVYAIALYDDFLKRSFSPGSLWPALGIAGMAGLLKFLGAAFPKPGIAIDGSALTVDGRRVESDRVVSAAGLAEEPVRLTVRTDDAGRTETFAFSLKAYNPDDHAKIRAALKGWAAAKN